MRETYELYVACRRSIAIGEPPSGTHCADLPRLAWVHLRAALPFAGEPLQVLELRQDGGHEPTLRALACACADAGDGVVLSIMPVTAPPRFELEHDGRGGAAADWARIRTMASAYQEAAQREVEAEKARRAAASAAWKGDARADDWGDLADIFKK